MNKNENENENRMQTSVQNEQAKQSKTSKRKQKKNGQLSGHVANESADRSAAMGGAWGGRALAVEGCRRSNEKADQKRDDFEFRATENQTALGGEWQFLAPSQLTESESRIRIRAAADRRLACI